MIEFSLLRFRSPLLTECMFVYLPPGTEMFYFPGYAPVTKWQAIRVRRIRFPRSEIFGSKVARHLPEAYRRHATSFIAFSSQGIHHTPLYFPLGNLRTACYLPTLLTLQSHVITKFIHRWAKSVLTDLLTWSMKFSMSRRSEKKNRFIERLQVTPKSLRYGYGRKL